MNILPTKLAWALSYASIAIMLSLPYTSRAMTSTASEVDLDQNVVGVIGGTETNIEHQNQERQLQTMENGEVVAGAMEAPVMVGMPLPPTTTDSPGTSTNDVEYSPIYNTRMKACAGYEAEGLKGYTTLDDLRHDLQLYFYDVNGYSYQRTAEDIAASLMTESPTGHPSASPSVSHVPTIASSDVPSTIPTQHPVSKAPTDEPTSSVRIPVEPTRSPSPTMLPKFAGVTSSSSTLLNDTFTEDTPAIIIPEGALGGDSDGDAGTSTSAEPDSFVQGPIFFGDGTNPADVLGGDEDNSTTYAPIPIPSLRTASPSRSPTLSPVVLDENMMQGGMRKRTRALDGEVDNDRRRLQEVIAEVMNENGQAELDEVVTMQDGEELLIPMSLSSDMSITQEEEEDGIYFHICPDTNFQFFNLYVAQLKYLPLVLETPVQQPVKLACLMENTCTFSGGEYHIVFNNNGLAEDDLGDFSVDNQQSTITVSGITFEESEEASIVMNGPRGKVIFDNCKWEKNQGEAIVVDGKYSGDNLEEEYYGVNDFMLPPGKEKPLTGPTMPAATTSFPENYFGTTTKAAMTTEFVLESPTTKTPSVFDGTRSLDELSAGSKSVILIRDSTFTGNKGKATIAVDSFSKDDEELGSDPSATGPIHLDLEGNTFSSERVGTSVIVTSGATVSSTGNVFERNTASSMIQTNSGTITITDTDFGSSNVVTGGEGVVVVDSSSKVGDTNCVEGSGEEMTGTATAPASSRQGGICEGVVVMTVGTCQPFGQVCDPNTTPTLVVDNTLADAIDVEGENGVEDGSDLEGENGVEDGSNLEGGVVMPNVNETAPITNVNETAPTMNSNETAPMPNVNETAPTIDVAQPDGTQSPGVVEDCHDNWTDLKYAVENRIVDGLEVLSHIGSLYFKICPNSTLDASSGPIVIDYDYITVQCGNDGRKSDNCQIIGGFVHFHIVGASTDIELAGLRMSSSTGSSIIAAGKKDATLKINDCEWMANSGASAVLIRNNATVDANNTTGILDITSMLASSEAAMSVVLSGAGFMQNVLTYGTIVNVGGSLTIDKGRFNGNEIRVGDVAVMENGELFIRNTCFDESASMMPGTIFIDDTSSLQENVNTFGFDNTDGGFDNGLTCTDIFKVAVGADCSTEANCNGTCTTFASKTCPLDVPSFPTSTPEGTDKAENPDTDYVRNKNPTDKASIVPVIVAVIICAFMVFGLIFIICKRRRKKPAPEAEFQGEMSEVDIENTI